MKTFIKPVYFLIATVFIASCSPDSKPGSEFENPQSTNPLDSILGDKIIHAGSGEKRQNNFQDFLTISRKNLIQKSALYDVTPVGTGFYTVNQKKTYSEARSFSALLKVEGEIVVKYQITNDFQIIDQIKNSDGIFVLVGNFGNYSEYWKTSNEIQLMRFDNRLNLKWIYDPKSNQYPLEAIEITDINEYSTVKVNVVTGCHICTNTFELKIDSLGNCFSAIEIYVSNSSVILDEQTIKEIFEIP